MPTTTISLDTVLRDIEVSNSEFMAAWIAEETQLRNTKVPSERDKLKISSMIPEWIDKIGKTPATSALSPEDKEIYISILVGWRDEIISNVSPGTLPEQGTKFVTGIVDKTRKFFDDIVSGTDDVSKIGFYDIPESDDPRGFPVIIPSSINIQEHLLNQPVPTVRSKSVAVIPNHRSKHTVSIDIIYPDFETFSSTEQDYPSFINLYHMFKFMPINSIYSSALSTVFINEFTFPKLFSVISEMYASDAITGDTYEEKLASLFEQIDTNNLSEIKGLFQSDSPDLDIGLRAIFDSITERGPKGQTGRGWDISEFDADEQDNDSLKFPVPVCFKSASIQTLEAMPGAVLSRFSFGIINSPAFPYGAITYRDINGKRTLDPNECYWGKRYVSLASKNLHSKKDEDLLFARKSLPDSSVASAPLNELTNNDVRLYYMDIHNGTIFFDTTSKKYARTDNQAPVVLEKVSAVFNSKTVDIPLMGSQFPTVQYMGMNSSSFQMILAVTDKKIIRDFMAMKAQIVDAEKSQYLLSSFGFIENPLINSLGISRVTPQSVTIESDPDSPGLYRLIINFVENVQNIDSSNRLQLEKGGIVQSATDDLWDYLYDLYKIWAVSQGILEFRDPNGTYLHSRTSSSGPTNPDHLTMLDTLMSVIGVNQDSNHMESILNPTYGEHGIPYGTLFMGIIADKIHKESGEKRLRPTGNLLYDFPELVSMRIGFWRSRIHEALIHIAFGSIRGDREGALSFGDYYFEIDRDDEGDPLEGKQQTIFSKALHMVLFGVEYDDPFIHKNKEYKGRGGLFGDWTEQKNTWAHKWGLGINTEENDYYELRDDLANNQYLNGSDIDVLDWEWPDFDDSLYGLEHTFTAKNLLDIYHTQKKILPKTLWDNILKVVMNREHTEKGKSFENLVHYESTHQSFTILYNLMTLHQAMFQFDIRTDQHDETEWLFLKAYGMEAKLNITKIEKEKKQAEQFEDVRVDMYPDLTLPTYEELFSSTELTNISTIAAFTPNISPPPRGPWDVFDPSLVRNNLMEVFAPKCGDKGVIPSKIPHQKLMLMTISDISDTVSSEIKDFIDPDIFYWRFRDKQLIAEAVAVSKTKDDDKDTLRGSTFYLPMNENNYYDNARARASALNDENLEFNLNKEKFIKDYAVAIADAIKSVAKGNETNVKSFKVQLQQELEDKDIMLSDEDSSLDLIQTYYEDMISGKSSIIEFVTSDKFLILTLVKDNEGKYHTKIAGTYDKPIIYNPISDMSIAMLDDKRLEGIHEQQLAHTPDLIESALRSFPTIRLYFIEEDREQVHYRDDFYGFSDIVECSISSNIYDTDVCTMKLGNFGGILSSQSFVDRAVSNIRVNKKDASKSIRNTKPEDTELIQYIDDAGGKFLRKILLRPGIHIMVKMGYGNNVNHLKTVFTGEIAEVKLGNVVEIIAQGFQTELQYDFGGFMQEDWMENLRHLVPLVDHPYTFGFLRIINFILLGDLKNSQSVDRKGTPHLGKKIIAKPYRRGGPFGSKNHNWGYDSNDNVIQSLIGADTVTERRYEDEGQDPLAATQIIRIFTPAFLESNYFGFTGYDLRRNIYSAESNGAVINKTNEYLVTNGPVIDSIREVVRYMPNFIATVVPYEQDATLFIGDPAGPYEFRKATDDERKYTTIINNLHKSQESIFNLNGKYNLLGNAINKKSTVIREKIKRHNRAKGSELLNQGLGGTWLNPFDDENYMILDGMIVKGSDGTVHPPRYEDEDLEELCQNVFFNPASGIRIGKKDSAIALSDEVHANLFALYMGISPEDVRDHTDDLAKVSKGIGNIYFDSRDTLEEMDEVTSIYSVGSASRHLIREEASGINRLYPLVVSSIEDYRKVRQSTESTAAGTLVNASGWFDTSVARAIYDIFRKSSLSKVKVNIANERPIKLLSFIDIIDRTHYRSWGIANSAQDRKDKQMMHEVGDYNPLGLLLRGVFGVYDLFAEGKAPVQFQMIDKIFGTDLAAWAAGDTAKETKLSNLGELYTSSGNWLTGSNAEPIMDKFVFEYKQFLMLADEVLNNTDPTEMDAELRELMKMDDDDRITMPFNYKIFRDTHVVSSTHDLIANNLTVSRSDMWSAINLRVPKDTVTETAGHGEYGMFAYGIDEPGITGYSRNDTVFRIQPGQDFGTYPAHGVSGVNYRGTQPGPRDIIEPFTEINATSPELAMRVMQNRIAQGLSKMYRGNLIMLGRNIKPYDKVVIVDDVNNMYGTVMVERVIQNFSAVNGWTTTIVPSALTVENSTLATYDAKWWQRIMYSMAHGRTFDAVMNVVTIATFVLPVIGGAVKLGQVGLNTVLGVMWAPVRIGIGAVSKNVGAWAATKAAARTLTHGGKWGVGRASKRLPGIWSAMRTAPDKGARAFASTEAARGSVSPAAAIYDVYDATTLGNIAIFNNIRRGMTQASLYSMGRTMVQGTTSIANEFFSPVAITGSPLFKKGGADAFSGANFLPAKVALLRYNGAPFAALPDLYDVLDKSGWNGLYTELGYMWREIWASSTDYGGTDVFEALGQHPEE